MHTIHRRVALMMAHPHPTLIRSSPGGGQKVEPPTPTLYRTELLSRKLLKTFFGLLIILILRLKAER